MRTIQERINFPATARDVKIAKTIWQPETSLQPWAVHVEGWVKGKVDVTIYHSAIDRAGKVTFPNLHLPDAQAFADFCAKIIGIYIEFRKGAIEYRSIDHIALINGYREGVNQGRTI